MERLFDWASQQGVISWCLISFTANLAAVVVSVTASWLLSQWFRCKRLFEAPRPLTLSDFAYSIGAIAFNSAITVTGWILWKHDWIVIRHVSFLRSFADTLLLIFVMDLAMYGFHRVAHCPMFFWLVHRLHHTHVSTNPLSLFVLNPFEVLGFGILFVAVLMIFPFSAGAVVAYLTFNLAFGTLGHLGVEPLPERLRRYAILRYLGTSSFHSFHHADGAHNFGFYTTLWDRLFNTLHPYYDAHGSVRLTAKDLIHEVRRNKQHCERLP